MRLELSDEVALELLNHLRESLGDLSMEISHTDSADFREMLKARRERLLEVSRQLDFHQSGEQAYV